MHYLAYLRIEGRSLLNLTFVKSFAERISNKSSVLVNYFSWLEKYGIIVFHTWKRYLKKEK